MRRLKKFKITPENRFEVHHQKTNSLGGWDDHVMISKEDPDPELFRLLDDLDPYLSEICEFAEHDYYKNPYKVRGLSFSYGGEDEVMGVTVSFQRTLRLSNSPLNLNTPHMIEEPYSADGDDTQVMSYDMLITIKQIMEQAIGYLDGKRAQKNLFETEPLTE